MDKQASSGPPAFPPPSRSAFLLQTTVLEMERARVEGKKELYFGKTSSKGMLPGKASNDGSSGGMRQQNGGGSSWLLLLVDFSASAQKYCNNNV